MGTLFNVLVVDENEFTGLLTVQSLERLGRPAVLVTSLFEAIRILDEDPPSMVLMAGPSMFDLLRTIADRSHLESLVRVALIDDEMDSQRCYLAGADLALVRPLTDEDWRLVVGRNP